MFFRCFQKTSHKTHSPHCAPLRGGLTLPGMAKPKTPPKPEKRPRGRPRKTEEEKAQLPPVTGVRIPEALRDEIDGLVDRENAALAAKGASTNRNALIVLLLREALDARKGAPYA